MSVIIPPLPCFLFSTIIRGYVLAHNSRSKKVRACSLVQNLIHMVGNEIKSNTHIGIESYQGALILAEGNTFIDCNSVSPRCTR